MAQSGGKTPVFSVAIWMSSKRVASASVPFCS